MDDSNRIVSIDELKERRDQQEADRIANSNRIVFPDEMERLRNRQKGDGNRVETISLEEPPQETNDNAVNPDSLDNKI